MVSFGEIPDSSDGSDLNERRQVTVLFADIVDYTAIALRSDPEDLRGLLQQYYLLARSEIEASGGVVAEYLADGVVAHFGTPAASHEAADQAVAAAKRIVKRSVEINSAGSTFSVRIGVATGVVVAEFDGVASKITGACSVLAARLQSSAEPGSIYISSLTRRLLRHETEVQFVGKISLKGFPDPEAVWSVASDETTQVPAEIFPFFGRQAELQQLAVSWETVLQTGRASPFHILMGPPGIGKSRVLREHLQRFAGVQRKIVLQATERQSNTALYPVVEWLRVDDRARPEIGATVYLTTLLQPEAAAALLLREAPGAIRQGTFDALATLFRKIALQGPVQVIVEDLHWLDHSTTQLIARLLADLYDCPIQWLASCRPEFSDRLGEVRGPIINVAELSASECYAAVVSCSENDIAPTLVHEIAARSEGVPLFLEHLLRESNEGRLSDHEAVPDTLVGALTAWIDRTGSARRIAQYASVIGRSFAAPLLEELADSSDVASDIERLCKVEILQRDSDAVLSFRHDLLRDAAYGTLLRTRRTSLHRRVAGLLSKGTPHAGDKVMAEIAHHHEAAGDYSVAADYRHRMGSHATALGAFIEGENQLRRAVDLLARAHRQGHDVVRQQANILVDLAANLMQTRGFTDAEVLETYMRSLSLLRTIDRVDGDSLAIFWGIFTYQVLIGRIKEAAMTVSRMETVLRRLPEKSRLGEHTLSVLGTRNGIQFYSGRFRAQLATLDEIKSFYVFDRDAPLAAKYGMDLLATAHAFAPHSAAITGQFSLARQLIAEGDAHQTRLEIPLMLPFVDIWGGVSLGYLGDFDQALARIERGIVLADQQSAAFWSATGRMWLAITEFDATGDPVSRTKMEQALAVQKLIGVGIGIPYWSAKLAAAYAMDGHDTRALELARVALAGANSLSEGAWRAERQRLCGLVHECAGRRDKAFSFYRLAAQTAHTQSASLWEHRARQAVLRLNRGAEDSDKQLQVIPDELIAGARFGNFPHSGDQTE